MLDPEVVLKDMRSLLLGAGMHPEAIAAFEKMYRAYRGGESGLVAWEEISPLLSSDLVRFEDLGGRESAEVGRSHLAKVVWVVLNGGLGTSMRMDRAKSLVPVRGRDTFLDLLARHVLDLRKRWNVQVPLLFMNSFATREDTLAALAPHRLQVGGRDGIPLPLDFVQHRFPRINEADGRPCGILADRSTWAPPGHGDLYLALKTSGVLPLLLDRGIRWAFVSNVDNLGASIDLGILGLMASGKYEFLMEVTRKTAADVKGGTLVRRRGRLGLLELAQVAEERKGDFQDVGAFPVFNTNNLWVDLAAVEERLAAGVFELPLIVNRKVVGGARVAQLETAMGAAVGLFSRTAGVLVPRSRFAPVKTTDDLLVRRGDAFEAGEASPLVPNPRRDSMLGPVLVRLDPRYYGSAADLDLRFSEPPSLVRAKTLEVVGDVRFGAGVTVVGEARVENTDDAPLQIASGTILGG
jgi:UTP--glucose-1-phosphate uridylyltransferase